MGAFFLVVFAIFLGAYAWIRMDAEQMRDDIQA